jgi:hypothetical protein
VQEKLEVEFAVFESFEGNFLFAINVFFCNFVWKHSFCSENFDGKFKKIELLQKFIMQNKSEEIHYFVGF